MVKIEIKQQKNIQSNHHHYYCGTSKTILIGKYLFKVLFTHDDDDDVWQHKNCPLLKKDYYTTKTR